MINTEKLNEILNQYKSEFATRWEHEKYKWAAVKHFQKHWDIDAADFTTMFEKATEKAGNLLGAGQFWPRKMISVFSNKEPKTVRRMFRNLFDENKPLFSRITAFRDTAERLANDITPGQQSYQTANAITTYLWLHFPEKYYMYKYSASKPALAFLSGIEIKRGNDETNIKETFAWHDELNAIIKKDSALKQMLTNAIAGDKDLYPDKNMKLMTGDIEFFISQQQSKDNESDSATTSDTHYWFLVTNPKFWDAKTLAIGDTTFYTFYENDEKRKIFENYKMARPGDKMLIYQSHPQKHIIGLAQVSAIVPDKELHFTKTAELATPISLEELQAIPELSNIQGLKQRFRGSLFKLTQSEYNTILKLISDKNPNLIITETPTEDETTFMSDTQIKEIISLLRNKQNIILQGAPGVGKTFNAKKLARRLGATADTITTIQFHQSYTYEDLMMGYKPNANGGFDIRYGAFYNFCKRAASNPDTPFVFIIDEINRGNISKIFGELLMLIESKYRGKEHAQPLAYDCENTFYVPSNVYLIGMMNTADRSIAMLDYAMRRRFAFVTLEPAFDSAGFLAHQRELNNPRFNRLIDVIKKLNTEISADPSLGPGFCIGHSYFCDSNPDLSNIVKYEIIPTIQEYWFDNEEQSKYWTSELERALND